MIEEGEGWSPRTDHCSRKLKPHHFPSPTHLCKTPREMDLSGSTCTIYLQIQIRCPLLRLRFGGLKNPCPFYHRNGRLGFPRQWKHLCLREQGTFPSSWDEKPFEILPEGRISYLDEQDIVAFVDPPMDLIPLNPESYNPASYLWKKLGDVPEERRHRLLSILKSKRHVPMVWELTGTRYQDAKLAKKSASKLLSLDENSATLEYWSCRISRGPMLLSWLKYFKKVIFRGKDGCTYGRIIASGLSSAISKYYGPLYFIVKDVTEVMSTEQPCDLAYEFGNGLLTLSEFPEGFPAPVKHRWPFNDRLVMYIRHAGPGVVVGQAWQEGNDLEKVPNKFCGEILMVKDFLSSAHNTV